MHDTTQLRLIWASVLAATAMLVGCGEKEPPAASPAPSAAAIARPAPLNVAFVYTGPVGDAGWTFAHDRGRKAVEAEFGDRIKTTVVENVPETAEAEPVIRRLVSEGNRLVFGTAFGYMDPMMNVAADQKGVKFEQASGFKTADNLRTYDSRGHEGAYLAGIIAGSMTKTNKLGVVGSIPIAEVIRNINSFTLGAQSVNPRIRTKVVWVGSWFDPPKESEAALSLIKRGVDVLFQNTDSSSVLQTAEKYQKLAFGWNSDMSAFAEQAHLASVVVNWGPYYKQAVRDVLDGGWTTGQAWWGVKQGTVDLVAISDKVPAETRAAVAKVKAGLKDGSIHLWRGPIVDRAGKTRVARGQVPDDTFLRGIDFYVKGVDGKLPADQR